MVGVPARCFAPCWHTLTPTYAFEAFKNMAVICVYDGHLSLEVQKMKQAFATALTLSTLVVSLCSGTVAQAENNTGLVISEVPLRPDRTLVLGAAQQDGFIIGVGERGALFISSDGGKKWQSSRSPTTYTLTSVVTLDKTSWIAGGHGGVLLRSDDAQSAPELIKSEAGRDSILGMTVLNPTTVLAYGAFGLMLRSEDAGKTWTRQEVIDLDFDRHIAAVIHMKDMLLLVGESGTLAKSVDEGRTWKAVKSPYEGSYFGATVTPKGTMLIFGMRGNIYRSEDRDGSWKKIDVLTKIPFYGASTLSDGSVVLTGGQGWMAHSQDDGRSFKLKRVAQRGISGAIAQSTEGLVLYGEQGLRHISVSDLKN